MIQKVGAIHNQYLNVKTDTASCWIHFKYKTFTSILDAQTNGEENVSLHPPWQITAGFLYFET